MDLDLDAFGDETLTVTFKGKKYTVPQMPYGDYLKVVNLYKEEANTDDSGDLLLRAIGGFAPGVFPNDVVAALSVRQLRALAEKLGKFQGAVDEGNLEPGGA